MSKVAIYIPAYNAASTLTNVLDRIPQEIKSSVSEIFIIDNNSSDATSMVAIGYKNEHNLHNLEVIKNPENFGYGGSQKIAYARSINKGFDCVAMLHGDAQYAPECLSYLMKPILNGEADMVFGSRIKGSPLKGGMPIHRYLGNRFLTAFQNIFLGANISEYHSGYRIYSVEALKKIPFERLSSDYHFDTEIIIMFIHHHLRIKEIPIPTHYGDEENYVNIWKYGLDVLITTFSFWLHKMGIRKSRNWTRIFGT